MALLLDRPQVRVITTRHENSAVYAAAGYAQTTGKLGVVVVTSGPGVLNCLNALGSAYVDGMPILILAGEAAREGFGRGAIQEGSAYAINVVGIAAKISKLAFEVTEATAAPGMLRRAMTTAMSGKRGPVFVSLPLNVLGATIPKPRMSLDTTTQYVLPQGEIECAAKSLTGSGRKVILAGSGARWGRGPQLLRQVAERLGCPVMTTPRAKGVFPEGHPLSLGIFGIGGHASTTAYLAEGVDTIMVVGSSLNESATDGWSPLLKARRTLIHVDIDAGSIGRVYPTDLGIAAPAEVVLEALLDHIPQADSGQLFGIQYDRDAEQGAWGALGKIDTPRALWELQQVLPCDTIYTTDSGLNHFFAAHYLKIDHADSFVSLWGLGSMGKALGAAVGAQLGNPERTVVAVIGDGGLTMTAGELSTAAAARLPIIVFVINDGTYGMVQHGNDRIYGRTPRYDLAPLLVSSLAEAFGCKPLVAQKPGDILNAGLGVRSLDRPLVIDVHIDTPAGIPGNRRITQLSRSLQVSKLN